MVLLQSGRYYWIANMICGLVGMHTCEMAVYVQRGKSAASNNDRPYTKQQLKLNRPSASLHPFSITFLDLFKLLQGSICSPFHRFHLLHSNH
jgi:hypothetical protein